MQVHNLYLKRHLAGLFDSRLLKNQLVDYCHFWYARRKIAALEGLPPRNLMLETTNYCNARCVMCGHKDMQRGKGFMPLTVFRDIVEDAGNCGIGWITLQGYGEPLLDREIYEKIAFARDQGVRVSFNTNASMLDRDCSRKLIEAGLDEIFISVDAWSKESFEKIRPPLDYETVKENIEGLLGARAALGSRTPKVNMTYVIQDGNEAEVGSFFSYWSGRCDRLIAAYAKDWAGQVAVSSRNSPHIDNSRGRDRNPCDYLWTSLSVQHDGSVALCCEDFEGRIALGNVRRQSLEEIWRGPLLQKYRQAHLAGRRGSMPLCRGCHRHINWINVN